MVLEADRARGQRPVVKRFSDLKFGILSIEGRAIFKSRTVLISKAGKHYFLITIVDEAGNSLRGSAYGSNCERLYPIVEGKPYVFRNVRITPADGRYNDAKFSFVFYENSKLEEQPDNGGPIFTRLDEVSLGSTVNLIGVIHEVFPVDTVRARGKRTKRCQVTIVDRSKSSILLTIWGHQAEIFDGVPGQVVVTKNAGIVEFAGKAASANGPVKVNSDIREAQLLKTWYMLLGRELIFQPLSRPKREPRLELDLQIY